MLRTEQIKNHFDGLVKPQGALGVWEQLAERLCFIQQTLKPSARPCELVVFAADHGVATAGVTLWPSTITTIMIEQIAKGGSASAVLAEEYGIEYRVVDVGTKTAPSITHPRHFNRRVAAGTSNIEHGPAMTLHEFREAMEIGFDEARMTLIRGAKVVIAGEMGIGNTTSASCIARLLADVPESQSVGNGAGATDESRAKKEQVVNEVVQRVQARCGHSIDEGALAEISGFEIVAIAGFYIQAAKQGQLILLDGMVASAGALLAQQYYPEVVENMIAAHQSEEPAHALMLERLGLQPMLQWNMRLGEGTGAIALFPLVAGATAWVNNMAKLSDIKP